jgi:hypothetical protein
MGELNADRCPLSMHETNGGRQRLTVGVRPKAEVLGRNAAFGRDGGRFGENETGATDSAATQMD